MATKEELQKQCVELKAKLDKLDARLEKANDKYDQFNDRLQQEGLSEDLKFLLAAAERDRAELRQQRDPLLARLTEIEKLLNPPPVQSVPQKNVDTHVKVLEPARQGIALFVVKQLHAELEQKSLEKKMRLDPEIVADDKQRLYDLAEKLNGHPDGREKLLIRTCMPKIIDKVISFLTTNPGRVMLLGGNRGCGKSVIGTLVVILLANQGRVVLYYHKGKRMIVMSKDVLPEQRAIVDEVFDISEVPRLPANGGCFLFVSPYHDGLWSALTTDSVIVVHDMGDTRDTSLIIDGKATYLLVSSPNASKLKDIKRIPTLSRHFVPTWTLDELLALESKVSSAIVEDRFRRMSGVPRWVTDAPEGLSERIQDEQITNLQSDALRVTMQSRIYEHLPTQVGQTDQQSTDLLFRIEPHPNDDTQCIAILTSDYVEQRLAYRFADLMDEEVLRFAAGVADVPTLATYRGHLLEARAHKIIHLGGTFEFGELTDSGWTRLEPITLPRSNPVVFNNLASLSEVRLNEYIRPEKKNFESVDAFMVVKHSLLDKSVSTDEPCLVGIQVTGALTHPTNGTGVKKMADHVEEHLVYQWPTTTSAPVQSRRGVLNRNAKADQIATAASTPRAKRALPIYLIFVVGSLGTLKKKQTIKTDKGGDMVYDGFVKKQFVMSLGEGYNRLFKICQRDLDE